MRRKKWKEKGEKGRKKEKERKEEIVKKFRLRYTLEICYGTRIQQKKNVGGGKEIKL